MFWPLDFSSAFIAVLVVEEDLALAILTEEPFLLLKFLCNRDTLAPASSAYPCEGNMLIYAAMESILSSFKGVLSQYHSKSQRTERMEPTLVLFATRHIMDGLRRDTVKWR